jgi:hypothetical protein
VALTTPALAMKMSTRSCEAKSSRRRPAALARSMMASTDSKVSRRRSSSALAVGKVMVSTSAKP